MSSGSPGRRIGCSVSRIPFMSGIVASARSGESPKALPKIGVAMPPGQMQLTRTPLSPSSIATERVRWMTAALAATSVSRLTSAWTYVARAPTSAATSRPRSSWMSAGTTEAPSSMKRRTVASPMPLAPPVTSAILPFSRCMRVIPPPTPERSPLFLEVVAGQRWPHVGAREEHRRDDLDRRVAAEPLAPDGRARRLAALSEQLDEEISSPVDHPGLIAEAGRRVHEADHVDDLLHALEVAESVLDGPQRRERRVASSLVALGHREVLADDAGQIALAVLPRRRAREIEEVLHREVRDVVRAGGVRAVEVLETRDGQSGLLELLLDRHGDLLGGSAPRAPPAGIVVHVGAAVAGEIRWRLGDRSRRLRNPLCDRGDPA